MVVALICTGPTATDDKIIAIYSLRLSYISPASRGEHAPT